MRVLELYLLVMLSFILQMIIIGSIAVLNLVCQKILRHILSYPFCVVDFNSAFQGLSEVRRDIIICSPWMNENM